MYLALLIRHVDFAVNGLWAFLWEFCDEALTVTEYYVCMCTYVHVCLYVYASVSQTPSLDKIFCAFRLGSH